MKIYDCLEHLQVKVISIEHLTGPDDHDCSIKEDQERKFPLNLITFWIFQSRIVLSNIYWLWSPISTVLRINCLIQKEVGYIFLENLSWEGIIYFIYTKNLE